MSSSWFWSFWLFQINTQDISKQTGLSEFLPKISPPEIVDYNYYSKSELKSLP